MTARRAVVVRGLAAAAALAVVVSLLAPRPPAVAAAPGDPVGVASVRACGARSTAVAACDLLVVDVGRTAAPMAATAAPTRATTTTRPRVTTTTTTRAPVTTTTTRVTTTTTTRAPVTTTTVAPPTSSTTVAPPTTTTSVAPPTSSTTVAPPTTTTTVAPGVGGFSPAQVKAAYGWPTSTTAGTGRTIVIVTAYHAPDLAADLAVFNAQFGLPACTVANGCLAVYNQTGGTAYPPVDPAWALETTADVQWAHAVAPGAKIVVVEATSASAANLMAAVNWGKLRGQYVSMSWGIDEWSGQTAAAYSGAFVRSGVSFFASAGNSGGRVQFPSASRNVTSVGGTRLVVSGATVTETAWASGGGGCSAFETAAPAQSGFSGYAAVQCAGKRATPDVAALADPATGVWAYTSTTFGGRSGWFVVGGTSIATPMVAARAAATGTVINAAAVYGTRMGFRDVTTGGVVRACRSGYDLCSGRGAWTGATP